jgi:hypothetical protein
MHWFCAITDQILREDNVKPDKPSSVLKLLAERVVALYAAVLVYQMKSVCFYFRHQGFNFVFQLAKWDDWDAALNSVKEAEARLQVDFDLHIKADANNYLKRFAECAEEIKACLGNIDMTLKRFIDLQEKFHENDKNMECLHQLCVVNPRDDMSRIERHKEALLRNVYKWFLSSTEFDSFTTWERSSCRMLWIKGHPGTGKTMLMMGVIRELSDQPATLAPSLAYFFCQGTGTKRLNTGYGDTAISNLDVACSAAIPHLASTTRV